MNKDTTIYKKFTKNFDVELVEEGETNDGLHQYIRFLSKYELSKGQDNKGYGDICFSKFKLIGNWEVTLGSGYSLNAYGASYLAEFLHWLDDTKYYVETGE